MDEQAEPWNNDPEYLEAVADIKDHPFIRDLEQFTHHVYSNRRLHSFGVSYYSFCIARKLDWDAVSTARGGLMHDLFFYKPGEVTFSKGNHWTRHPEIALYNARVMTDLNDTEEDIIYNHMLGVTFRIPKHKETYIVSGVDKYLATEEFLRPFTREKYEEMENFTKKVFLKSRQSRLSINNHEIEQ